MKNVKVILGMMLIIGLAIFTGCKDDDDDVETFTLVSLETDGGIDLAGVTSASDVPEDAVIIATFSSNVDQATVNKGNFEVTETESGTAADYDLDVNGAEVTMTPVDGWPGGSQLSINLSGGIEGENGVSYDGNVLTFRTSGIFVPQEENQVLFLSFDNQMVEDEAGNHTVNTVGNLTFETDRWGNENSAAYFDGEGNLVVVDAASDLVSENITISFWFWTPLSAYDGSEGSGEPQTRFVFGLAAEKGYFLEMGRRSNNPEADGYNEVFLKYGTSHTNIGENATSVPIATHWGELNSQLNVNFEAGTQSGWSFAIDELSSDPPNRNYVRETVMGEWTHLVLTVDASSQAKTYYINGEKVATHQWISSGADWLFSGLALNQAEGVDGKLTLGFAASPDHEATGWANYDTQMAAEVKKFFQGSIDQFRIFSVPLSDTEVQQLYDNEQ